jgi:predicted Zn-dependent peptidase
METGLFGIYAGTGEDEAAELVPATLEELHRVQIDANEAELRRAKAQVKASLLMSMESTGSRCEQLSRQMQIFGRIIPAAETVAKLEAVTVEDIRRAATRIFRGTPTLAAMGPAQSVPSLSDITLRLAA